jgi:hypothetical protein
VLLVRLQHQPLVLPFASNTNHLCCHSPPTPTTCAAIRLQQPTCAAIRLQHQPLLPPFASNNPLCCHSPPTTHLCCHSPPTTHLCCHSPSNKPTAPSPCSQSCTTRSRGRITSFIAFSAATVRLKLHGDVLVCLRCSLALLFSRAAVMNRCVAVLCSAVLLDCGDVLRCTPGLR